MENLYTSFESFISEYNGIDYEYESEGDDFHYITAYKDGVDAGSSAFEEKIFDEDYFKRCGWSNNDMSMVFANEDKYVSINTVIVKPNFRRMGIAKNLMNLTMQKIKELGYNIVYLCAYPMGTGKKTTTQELIDFYKSYGFKVVLQDDHGAEMYTKL